jgi:ABC-type multidrug transport system fused ATPase/permease subunit
VLKELKTYNKEKSTLEEFAKSRYGLSLINQKTSWLGNVLKYIFEIVILISGVIVAFVLIATTDARRTVSVVVVFLAMGFRLIPSIQRVQNAFIGFRVAEGASSQVFELFEKYKDIKVEFEKPQNNKLNEINFDKIIISKVNLSREVEGNKKIILDDINLTLNANTLIL